VTATTTSAGKLGLLERLGAEGIVMDGLTRLRSARRSPRPGRTRS
jgi:hypothetical protein